MPNAHVVQWLGMFWLASDVVFIVRDEMYVVWRVRCEKRSGKNTFYFKKNYAIEVKANLSYPDKSRPHSTRLLQRPQSYTYQMSPKFPVNVILCAQPSDSMTHLQDNKTQTMLSVHDIQMLWYHWCEIHTLMRQFDWCVIHALMRRSDWWEQHTTLHANIGYFFH